MNGYATAEKNCDGGAMLTNCGKNVCSKCANPMQHDNGATPSVATNGGAAVTFDDILEIADFLRNAIGSARRPRIAIICGSGLGGLASALTEPITIPYGQVPKFPVSTVPGHAGCLVFGKLNGRDVVCMNGRFHTYEGYPMWKVAMPVRVFGALGVQVLIVTNAAGALHPDYNVGDLMIISDHINVPGFSGGHPLVGIDDKWGSRFLALHRAYDRDLRRKAKEIAGKLGMVNYMREGVYAFLSGPTYETAAEARTVRIWGADAVGMSTVPEVVVAKHTGMRVLGLSLITNRVAQDDADRTQSVSHHEVLQIGQQRAQDVQTLVSCLVEHLDLVDEEVAHPL